jgi:hypothetical protein
VRSGATSSIWLTWADAHFTAMLPQLGLDRATVCLVEAPHHELKTAWPYLTDDCMQADAQQDRLHSILVTIWHTRSQIDLLLPFRLCGGNTEQWNERISLKAARGPQCISAPSPAERSPMASTARSKAVILEHAQPGLVQRAVPGSQHLRKSAPRIHQGSK